MEKKTLRNPPIKEAILDTILNYPDNISIDILESFGEIIKEYFPNKKPIHQFQSEVIISSGKGPQENNSTVQIGFAFVDSSGNKMLQIRQNGFSFIQLNKTYKSWNEFSGEAYNWLFKFSDFIGIKSCKRISLRYVNRIELSVEGKIYDLEDYFSTVPAIGETIEPINKLFMRVEIPSKKYDATGIITEIMQPAANLNNVNLILDIDVIREREIQLDEKIQVAFEELRNFKNDIFFGSLQEKTAEFFK